MYKTHKKNVHKRHAFRAQILFDTKLGYFRDVIIRPSGTNNDQKMFKNSHWDEPDAVVSRSKQESIMGDGGYAPTVNTEIKTPATKKEIKQNPSLKAYNKCFNSERSQIERAFAQIKMRFNILSNPWRRSKKLFPLCLRVCLKLMNRYWRLYGSLLER